MTESAVRSAEVIVSRPAPSELSYAHDALGAVTLTDVSAVVPDDLPEAEWRAAVRALAAIERRAALQVGDLLAHGTRAYGYAPAAAGEFGYTAGTIRNYVHVANRVPPEVRHPDLSWSHHYAVASVRDPEEQRRWLARAAKRQMTAEALRRARRYEGRPKKKPTLYAKLCCPGCGRPL